MEFEKTEIAVKKALARIMNNNHKPNIDSENNPLFSIEDINKKRGLYETLNLKGFEFMFAKTITCEDVIRELEKEFWISLENEPDLCNENITINEVIGIIQKNIAMQIE